MGIPHRWSVSHNFMAGVTAGAWMRILRENRFRVDPLYWHRAAFITLTSLLNSWYARRETRHFGAQVEATEIEHPPIFILGHWRSGTTHLHNLLAQDRRFTFPNTYQVVNPLTFLTTEAVNTRRFAKLLPEKRLMDEMKLGFDLPQEDEFAPCLVSGRSLYLGIVFPRREAHYERYLTFEDVPAHEVQAWQAAMRGFVKKLTFLHGRPVILKSPPHTARIALLRETFPGARFVHIHRHPYRVFRSFQHYYDTAVWYSYLQRPDRSTVDARILERYSRMYDAYFAQREELPPGQLHEVRFEELEERPLEVLREIYEALDLPDFDEARPDVAAYLETLTGYRKNAFQPLPEDTRRAVYDAWKPTFDAWGYEP